MMWSEVQYVGSSALEFVTASRDLLVLTAALKIAQRQFPLALKNCV